MNIKKLHPELGSQNRSFFRTTPSCLWFMSQGYKQADPRYTKGSIVWLHPKTNDALGKYGQKLSMRLLPYKKYGPNLNQYLALDNPHGSMYLARLKYLTFKGEIKPGDTIDHIDGNTMNNDIRNLRAIPRAINDRDGGFMRKLRNNKIYVAMFPGIILEGYERMARWKETHTEWQYRCLRGLELERVFFGPTVKVVDPAIVDDLELNKHYDPFIERD